ncbi:ataxin-10-like, partial [Actinia tenebrosa]|uniref:Ataxin-10-like n=1 Tax=Actinia tenebrosa TaxID=6105 RepID=A0A6P8IUV6_ACTTE
MADAIDSMGFNNSKWNDSRKLFDSLKMMAKNPDYRSKISSSNFDQAQQFLVLCEKELSSQATISMGETLVSCLEAVTEALRFLRNSSAGVPQNQEYIVTKGVIQQVMKITHTLLRPRFQESDEINTVNETIKIAIQLIGNVTVGNTLTQESIWKQCYPDFFLSVMTSASLQIQNCMCMVIYNSMTSQQRLDLVSSHQGLKIMSQILHLCSDHDELEWGYFIVETLVRNGHTGDLYKGMEFDPSARIILLDLIQVHLAGSNSNSSSQEPSTPAISQWSVPDESLVFLADEFDRTSDTFFQKEFDCLTAENMLDALLIARLLSLLSKATALHLSALQNHIQLLQKALDLLHQTNKPQNRDRFSNTLSVPQSHDSGKLSPTHGFKRDLVRLIGNMCYQ